MEIKTTFGPVNIIRVRGNVNVETGLRLVHEADEFIDHGSAYLILDMRGVDDINTGGLIALQTIVERATNQGGSAVLCRVADRIAKIIEVMQVGEVEIFPDVLTAIGALSNRASNRP